MAKSVSAKHCSRIRVDKRIDEVFFNAKIILIFPKTEVKERTPLRTHITRYSRVGTRPLVYHRTSSELHCKD